MPRPRKPWWNKRDGCYYTRIDGRQVMLRHPSTFPGRPGPKVGHNDEAGVRAVVARLLAEYDALVQRVHNPTVADLCRDYLIAATADCEVDTLYGKEWILERWCAFGDPPYRDRPARSIDSADLHRMRRAWEADGYAGGMLRRLYREVGACWAWAARPEPERVPKVILERNPLAGMRLPGGSERSPKYVPLIAIRELIAFAGARAEKMGPLRRRFEANAVLMLRLLAETGCRPKEACEARWEEFDAEAGLIVLKRHKTAKKTRRARTIVVPRAIVDELVALRGSGHAHPERLFAHPRSRGGTSVGAGRETGAPWTRPGFSEWFRKLTRRAAKEGVALPDGLTLYWLRHSYLTDAQMALDSERAANLAGNTKEMARNVYLHVQSSELRDAAEKVARRREGSGGE